MDYRQEKGKLIARTRQIKVIEGGFAVQSQTAKRFYFVDFADKCTCPDYETRQSPCKHVNAVYYYKEIVKRKGKNIQAGATRQTYSQDWPAYNKSQSVEKEYFLKLLKDLTTMEQEQNFGRPRANLGEMAFCCALKVYTQFSTRRANTDIKEAFEKGF